MKGFSAALLGHLQIWVRRYLHAEAVSVLAALFLGSLAASLTDNNAAVAAIVAAWGETSAYYATMLFRERRAFPQQPLWQTLTNLTLEFGIAEVLDSVFIRPTLMYLAGQLLADVRPGILVGKLASDAVFYIPTIAAFELRQRYRGVRPTNRVSPRVAVGLDKAPV